MLFVSCTTKHYFIISYLITPQVNSYYSCYKMLGYDIFLDDKLAAHLIGETVHLANVH